MLCSTLLPTLIYFIFRHFESIYCKSVLSTNRTEIGYYSSIKKKKKKQLVHTAIKLVELFDVFVIPPPLSFSLSLSLFHSVVQAFDNQANHPEFSPRSRRLRPRVDKLAGDCDEKRNGSRCQRFSVVNLRGCCARAPGLKSGVEARPWLHSVRFRETKEVAGEPAELEQGNWGVLSSRCDTGARDANGVAETMSTLIGEHHADDSYREVRCAGFLHTPLSSPSAINCQGGGGKVRESNGRYLST